MYMAAEPGSHRHEQHEQGQEDFEYKSFDN